jgi:signal recognition particle GTPase
MFEGITDNLKSALSFMNRGRLTETSIREGMQTVRQALLEADVNYDVAQNFVERVTERAIGDDVLKSISPTEQIVGIVNQELIELMGPVDHSLHFVKGTTTILMMCGLQGAGKTTTCGKLAKLLQAEGRQLSSSCESSVSRSAFRFTPKTRQTAHLLRFVQTASPRRRKRERTSSSSTPPVGSTSTTN